MISCSESQFNHIFVLHTNTSNNKELIIIKCGFKNKNKHYIILYLDFGVKKMNFKKGL